MKQDNLNRLIHKLVPALLMAIVVIAASSGCRTWNYRPTSLPKELAAVSSPRVDQLDLTALTGKPVRNQPIQPGDVLEVTAITGVTETPEPWNVRVDPSGQAHVPLVGPVRLAGYDADSAEQLIRQASIHRQVYRNPTIALAVKERKVNRITVAGAVQEPGVYELPAFNSNLGAALLAAGGLTAEASPTVEVRNPRTPGNHEITPLANWPSNDDQPGIDSAAGRPVASTIDLVSATSHPLVQGSWPRGDFTLQDGAYVLVNAHPEKYVHVIGAAANRTIELPPGREMRLLDALSEAGGPTYSNWVSDRVHIIRRVPGEDESVTIRASIRRAKRDGAENILLTEGDVVSVEENVVTFTLGTVQGLLGTGFTAARIGALP